MPTPEIRTYSASRESFEFREQLSSDKRRIVFLFGAGTSQAVGIAGIADLTAKVAAELPPLLGQHFSRILLQLGPLATVEHVLDRVRLCRELLKGSDVEEFRGLSGSLATELDRAICRLIFSLVGIDPPGGFEPHIQFASWIHRVSRAHAIEIFTTNYDVLVERGLETMEVPHFDGFVGTYEPRFSAASIEADAGKRHEEYRLPRGWARVWKLHGSITWRLKADERDRYRLIRVVEKIASEDADLMIFPSRDKYSESRKLPFVAYHDRLRQVLTNGEVLLITAGYSFSDQHINEIIFEALRWNNRLALTALIYGTLTPELRNNLLGPTSGFSNLTVYAADCAAIGGIEGRWTPPTQSENASAYWDLETNQFSLGDFRHFCKYLWSFLGSREYGNSDDGRTAPSADASDVSDLHVAAGPPAHSPGVPEVGNSENASLGEPIASHLGTEE